ncbi:MAG: DctP family TRAP transporter solute-binding subunit, partial [Planctomycetes bacterium]|nr:DctP family TRAP transporter solute-binding subunit [Planctomycetota bacterium]
AVLSVGALAVELKLGHIYEPAHPWHVGAEMAARLVEERTEGRVLIKVFPSGVLGTESELLEQVVTGGVDIAEEGSGQIANLYDPITITEMPYIFEDNPHLMRFLKSEKFADMKADFLEETGARIIGSSSWGIRHIIGNRAIHTPDDLDDFKLRVPDQRITVQYAMAMGAKPTPLAYSEAYMALQQNVVDGLENPLVSIQSMKFHEVAKTLSLTGHVITTTHFIINEDSYESLSKGDQEILEACFMEACDWIQEAMDESDRTLVDFFREQGLDIVESDRAAFQVKTKSMSDEYAGNWAKFGDLYTYIQDLK